MYKHTTQHRLRWLVPQCNSWIKVNEPPQPYCCYYGLAVVKQELSGGCALHDSQMCFCRCQIQRPAAINGLFHNTLSRLHSGCGFKRFHRKSDLSRKPEVIQVKPCSSAMHSLGGIVFARCSLFASLRSFGIFQLGLLASEVIQDLV